ncbi:MAG TPA: hypothetical protein VLV17_07710 [Anaeromyxobacteraceae bacterium]|nr:hypothetical protein [Anaeromyxobacteraceae bacterium]
MVYDHALEQVKRKFVRLMRTEPPAFSGELPREPLAPAIDRWVASRFSSEEVQILFRFEHEYGETVMGDWFSEILAEAGLLLAAARVRVQ